jgi:hypothetical protein
MWLLAGGAEAAAHAGLVQRAKKGFTIAGAKRKVFHFGPSGRRPLTYAHCRYTNTASEKNALSN